MSIGNHLSSAANISSGVPQGSVLGPLLFILYINDFPLAVGLSSVMLYADDTVIFTAASSINQLQLTLSLDLNTGFVPFLRNKFPELFQDFSKTQIDFSRTLKFTLTLSLP